MLTESSQGVDDARGEDGGESGRNGGRDQVHQAQDRGLKSRVMVDELRNGKQETKNGYQDHSSNEVVGFVHKCELHTILKQDFSDQPSFERLKAHSDHEACCLRLKSVIDAHIHEGKFVGIRGLALDTLEDLGTTIEGLVFELDGVVLELAATLDWSFYHWEALTGQDGLVDNALAAHENHIARENAVLRYDHEVSRDELIALDYLLFVLSDYHYQALVTCHISQLLVISNIFSYFHENTEKGNDSNHNGVAVEVLLNQ